MIKGTFLSLINMIGKVAVMAIVAYLLIYGGRLAYSTGYELMASDGNRGIVDAQVTVPRGATTEDIADILYEHNLIGSPFYFRVLARFYGHDGSFQYGDYHLSTVMSEEDMMKIMLTEGYKQETVRFTIPEGYTVDQIARRLASEGIVDRGQFLDAVYASDFGYSFMDQIPDRIGVRLEGYLFPETYEIYKETSAEQIVSVMLGQFEQVFDETYRQRAEELGLTIDQVITIASIIEREARVADERKKISGVIYNRLSANMNLEMCSTIMFVLDKPRDRVLYADLKIDSPYNTYMYSGLPLGPIASPGKASIEAALYPEEHDFFFFVLVNIETGEHIFTKTYQEHQSIMNQYKLDF